MTASLSEASLAVRDALAAAGQGLVEREQLVDLIALTAIAGEHLLVIGPPGTAKSEAVRRVARTLGGRYFEYLLGRFTEPSEVFGPIDLRKLKEGIVETQTAGMLPEADIASILERYAKAGVSNILALGGDPPKNLAGYDRAKDAFQHAADLVAFIKKFNDSGAHPDKRGFGIAVAGFPEGHPSTPNRVLEMDYLKAKCDAGADYICTQLFFDNHDFFDFRERCQLAGIKIPIIAGIMPITSASGMRRMAELAAGARYPAKLLRAIQRCGNDEDAVQKVGIHYATEQCHDLLDHGVDGIHFYTLNQSRLSLDVINSLGANKG
jgi:methylenetetrahydrofolate reductase (NADPH)